MEILIVFLIILGISDISDTKSSFEYYEQCLKEHKKEDCDSILKYSIHEENQRIQNEARAMNNLGNVMIGSSKVEPVQVQNNYSDPYSYLSPKLKCVTKRNEIMNTVETECK